MFHSQRKYELELLDKTSLGDVKSVISPMCTDVKLSTFEGKLFDNPTLNISVVGNLQYATLTHPYLGFHVNKVC